MSLIQGKNLDSNRRIKIFTWVLFASLTGCSSQRFDCPYKEGVRCMRLSDVDQKISAGATNKTPAKPLKNLTSQPVPDSPFRTSEEVLIVWVAPYQTEDGTFHEEKRLHFVAKSPEWRDALTEIKDEDEPLTKNH